MGLTNLVVVFILSIFASTIIARKCPIESDCIQNLCKDITYDIGGPDYETPLVLTARCKNDAGNEVLTWIDLRCGGHKCKGCRLEQDPKEEGSTLYLYCSNCPRKNWFWRGNNWSWLDISYGIWVKNGVIGCYDHYGSKTDSLKTLGKI
ncbi:cvnh domain-containing protein [Colletotrichum kahawae]|uniref:Cvnh domain-containing protein n=1 Tax=Colletotrichum kahawae TaxID=34407 RepID=A0AAE0DEE6_COLKA|nr:cvnh domain-containing protein [Colletotrichum kahawae]